MCFAWPFTQILERHLNIEGTKATTGLFYSLEEYLKGCLNPWLQIVVMNLFPGAVPGVSMKGVSYFQASLKNYETFTQVDLGNH